MLNSNRIWYQSFVDPVEQKNYINRLQTYLDSCADDGFKFEVHGITPPDKNLHPLTEFRCAAQTIKNAIAAQKAGYQAFVIGHFQEPGINEIKATIDIPVVGLGETSVLTACNFGKKFGLVTINPVFIPWHENQVTQYGLQNRIIGVRAVDAQVHEFEAAFFSPEVYQKLRNEFIRQMKSLASEGAEVLILAGGLPMLLFANEKNFMIDGAAVLNGIAAAAKTVEMMIKLKKLTGITVSQCGMFRKATTATIHEFLNSI